MTEYNETVETTVGIASGTAAAPPEQPEGGHPGAPPVEFGEETDDNTLRMNPAWPPEKPKVAYVGAYLYPTGYGEAVRSHAKALQKAGAGVMAYLNSMPHPSLNPELVQNDHAVNEMLDQRFWPADESQREPMAWILHLTPDEYRRHHAKPYLGYAVWECEGLPDGWAAACNGMDGILTCSDFSARLFREGGVTVPIGVCPHPIDTERFAPATDEASLRDNFRDVDTLFLVVSQWMFRKGVEDVLLAYGSEFAPDEKVGLVLATWRWSHSFFERQEVKKFSEFILRGLNKPVPRVWFIGDSMPMEAIPIVYRSCDALVTASRGEAFCLPVFEAAACGIPSIATAFGGMWDFLDEASAYPVECDMETVHGAGPKWKHYNAGQKWARPRLDSLRAQMRKVHEDRAGRMKKGARARQIVLDNLTQQKCGETMLSEITRIVGISNAKAEEAKAAAEAPKEVA